MSILSHEKGPKITIITKKGEKILMFDGVFLEKFYFLTGVTLTLYQKSNSTPKNSFFSKFSRKYFTKKWKNNSFSIKHVLTYFFFLFIKCKLFST